MRIFQQIFDRFMGPRIIFIAPLLILLLFFIPVAAGLLGSLLPAFGYFPSLGRAELTFDIWQNFWQYPGVERALALSFFVGLAASFLAFWITQFICASLYQKSGFRWLRRLLGPVLSLPHVSLAIGLLFLFAPSGWLFRLVSPEITGLAQPVSWSIFPDANGAGLVLALAVKEVPFLLLMTLSSLERLPMRSYLHMGRGLGYQPVALWLKVILPQIYGQIRLPVFAVLVFSVSVVDMSLILLPHTVPNLAMLILRWYGDADLSFQFLAALGSLMQMGLVLLALGCWWLGEIACRRLLHILIYQGKRALWSLKLESLLQGISYSLAALMALLSLFSVLLLLIWSFAGRWTFPDNLPSRWSGLYWQRHLENILELMGTSIFLAAVSSALSLLLVIACLEAFSSHKRQYKRRGKGGLTRLPEIWQIFIYIPLLLPQIAFLFGVHVWLVRVNLDGKIIAVIWGHLLFVLPYTYLSLAGAWLGLDERYSRTARAFGFGRFAILLRVKIPLLLRNILIAFAVGFAVSIAQYLPTFLLGAGRIDSLTTEAIALVSGGDRRVIGVYAFLQAILPFLVFGLAYGLPRWIYRKRQGMKGFA